MERKRGQWSGFAEVVFALVIVGGVVEIVRGAAALWAGLITLDVGLKAPIEQIAAGYELHRDTGELRLLDPSWAERLLGGAPHVVTGVTVVVVAALLLKVVRTLRDGVPFTAENATRLARSGWAAGIGGTAAVVATAWSEAVISGNAPEELDVVLGASLSFAPLMVAGVLLALAEVFRRGVSMQAELDEVI